MNNLRKKIGWVSIIKEMGGFLLIVLLLNQFFVMNTEVPSASMEPTIMTGDRTWVTQVPFYYREPKRGEIVVFNEGDVKMVKRVIALSGETIDIRDGKVYIEGKELDESGYLDESVETLYEEMPYEVHQDLPYQVPENHYFMMGDNRMWSMDSRAYGPIARQEIIAKGSFRYYPFNKIGIIQ